MAEVFGESTDYESPNEVSLLNHFIAGSVGGFAGIVVGHPFDTVKVQTQTIEGKTSISSIIKNLRSIGLINGLYRGVTFPAVSQGGLCAIFFAGYGHTTAVLQERYPQ